MTKKSPKFLAFMERKLAPVVVILKLQHIHVWVDYKGKNFVRYSFSEENGNIIDIIDLKKEKGGTLSVYSYYFSSREKVPVKELNEFVLNNIKQYFTIN